MEKEQDYRRGIRINKKALLFAVILLPFFEPMTFGLLEGKGINASLWGAVGMAYLLLRVAIVTVAFVIFMVQVSVNRFRWSKARVFLLANTALWGVSSLFTHSADMRLWANVYQNVGFVVLCSLMMDASRKRFFEGCIMCFGLLTVAGAFSILLHPYGYLNGSSSYDAYYLLGGKNGSFPYYYFFFYSAILYSMVWRKKSTILYLFYFLTAVAIVICQSSNSLICLTLIIACDVLRRYLRNTVMRINPESVMIALVVLIVLIYVGNSLTLVANFLDSIGRDMTFSGRDVLWRQAFGYIAQSPLWGKGYEAIFILGNLRDAGHAHSQYLHRLASYGIVPFVFFVAAILSMLTKGRKSRNKFVVHSMELLFCIYLLHMAFDTYPYYFPLLLILMGEATIKECSVSATRRAFPALNHRYTEICLRVDKESLIGYCKESGNGNNTEMIQCVSRG